jgi:uncharacterized protein (TIGR00297 family)
MINNTFSNNFLLALFFSAIISFLSYRFKFLNYNGTIAVFVLAAIIFGFGGWKWTIPILAFFLLSSLISKVKKQNNGNFKSYIDKTGKRDHIQVIANGGLGGILVILNYFFPSELFYFVFVSSVAAVCSDTWSTEIGTFSQAVTLNILTFKIVQQGISGGISLIGTLGGILGAAAIALSSIFWISAKHLNYIFFIIFAGIIGNLFDSIIGASIQAKYKCDVCSKITEKIYHCSKKASLIKGIKWINNDMVNFATAIIGGLFGFLFLEIF